MQLRIRVSCWMSSLLFLLPLLLVGVEATQSGDQATPSSFLDEIRTDMTKEERAMILDLERKNVSLEKSKTQFDKERDNYKQMNDLLTRGIVTGDELTQAREDYENAEFNYRNAQIALEQELLTILEGTTHISVVQGQRYRTRDGVYKSRIVLKNTSNAKLASIVEQAWAKYRKESAPKDVKTLLNIDHIFVSILYNGILIGNPYELHIPSLPYGEERALVFELQEQNAQNIQVQIRYLGRTDRRTIYLQKKSAEDVVMVRSLQFAQEGNLGSSVLFDLGLERLSESEKTFTLDVANLPEKYRYRFEDGGKQVAKVKFAQGKSKLNLNLRVYVPEEMPPEELDQSIHFFAVVADAQKAGPLRTLKKKHVAKLVPEKALDKLKVGYEFLELTPRGVGEIELTLANFYYETELPNREVPLKGILLKNTGTVLLTDVRVMKDVPHEWEIAIQPEVIPVIEPKEEHPIEIRVILPEDVDTGEFPVKIWAECDLEGEFIKTQEKDIKVKIKSKTSLTTGLILVGGLVLLLIAVAGFTIKLSRR